MVWNKEEVIKYLEKDKWYIYEIKKKQEKNIRSIAQSRYYFWIIIPIIATFHWYTVIETHELIKCMFKLKTTTNISTSEFKFLCESIIDMWKVKYNVTIPLPRDASNDRSLYESLWF